MVAANKSGRRLRLARRGLLVLGWSGPGVPKRTPWGALWAYLRMRYAFFILPILVLLSGTAGYMVLERMKFIDALYMTVITVTTVGYFEVQPLSMGGRIYTIMLLFPGIATVFVAATQFGLDAAAWAARRDRERRSKEVRQMTGHYIVCGYGRMGKVVSRLLEEEGQPLVVVERDPDKVALLRQRGVPVVEGDATFDETLENAGIAGARGLVALLQGDPDNVFVTLTARGLNPNLQIVARANNDDAVPKLYRAGASKVVNPHDSAGSRIATTLMRPVVLDFMDVITAPGELRLSLEEILIQPGSHLHDRALRDSRLRESSSALVVGVRSAADGTMTFNPSGHHLLHAGDVLIVLSPSESLGAVASLATAPAG